MKQHQLHQETAGRAEDHPEAIKARMEASSILVSAACDDFFQRRGLSTREDETWNQREAKKQRDNARRWGK